MNITHIKNNIYVGDQTGARSLMSMIVSRKSQNDLPLKGWAILNVAWDLDIKYPDECYMKSSLCTATNNEYDDLAAEHHKVGLVDGPGNLPLTLASAALLVHQLNQSRKFLCTKDTPEENKNAYSPVTQILVHCHSGHSRSVTVAGAYLYKNDPGCWNSVADAISFVAKKRGVGIQQQTKCLVQLAGDKGTQKLIDAGWNLPYLEPESNCCPDS